MVIKIAIVGVANCSSSNYRGLHYYENNNNSSDLIKEWIGEYDLNSSVAGYC